MKKSLILLTMILCAICLLSSTPAAYGQPQAICVPWEPAHPDELDKDIHNTYDGAEITLKGIARGGATEYRWDYGDGGGTA